MTDYYMKSFEISCQPQISQSIQEWTKENLWKETFKKFKFWLFSTSFTGSILEYFVPNINVQRVIKIVSLYLLHLLSTLSSFLHSLNVGMMQCVEPTTIYAIFAALFSHTLILATRFIIILAVTLSIDLGQIIS